MYEIKTKALKFELKTVGEAGEFEGFAAVYEVRDENSDFIHRGAFARTLHHKGGKFPILWQHQMNEPLGFLTATDADGGLHVKGRFNLEVVRARETHALMKQAKNEGVPFGLSIGYDAINPKWEGNTRHLREIRLWEVSPTLFPSQELATVMGVKQMGKKQATEGKPFGEYETFEDCISANQDKENPEGYCAWLHQQITGEWPTEGMSSKWQARVAALPEVKLSREQVTRLCPPCGEKMARLGLKSVTIGPRAVKQMPEQLFEGLCAAVPGESFTSCMEKSFGDFSPDEKEAFCAWLHYECTGEWPGEKSKHLALLGAEYGVKQAEALRDSLTADSDRSSAPEVKSLSDSDLASLWALLLEMRIEVRNRA